MKVSSIWYLSPERESALEIERGRRGVCKGGEIERGERVGSEGSGLFSEFVGVSVFLTGELEGDWFLFELSSVFILFLFFFCFFGITTNIFKF
jgi:hypothetical protein